MVVLFVFLIAFPVWSEQVAEVKAPERPTETLSLSADSFYSPATKRDVSWPKKLEVVGSSRNISNVEIKALLKSEKTWNVRFHCDGFPFFC